MRATLKEWNEVLPRLEQEWSRYLPWRRSVSLWDGTRVSRGTFIRTIRAFLELERSLNEDAIEAMHLLCHKGFDGYDGSTYIEQKQTKLVRQQVELLDRLRLVVRTGPIWFQFQIEDQVRIIVRRIICLQDGYPWCIIDPWESVSK